MILQQIYSGTVYQIPSESPEFYIGYYQKTFWSLFSGHTVCGAKYH